MRLRAEQLADKTGRGAVAPVYHIFGDEPLQMLEAADQIRRIAREQGCEERNVLQVTQDFDWNQLAEISANLSLFAGRRLIELRLGSQKPGKAGSNALVDYASRQNNEDVLMVTSGKLDKRTQQARWFRALDAAGVTVQIKTIEPGRLPDWIKRRMQTCGKHIDADAANLIAARVEGNLLAARQEIDKLVLLVEADSIGLQDVMETVSDNSRFAVFDLVENSMTGNIERVARMLRGLKGEGAEPMSIFGPLMWKFRQVVAISHQIAAGKPRSKVFADNHIWKQQQFAINAILRRYSDNQLQKLLQRATVVDKAMKGAIRANAWDLLEIFLFRLAGVRLQSFPDQ